MGDRLLDQIVAVMKNVNLILILFLSLLMSVTTGRICRTFGAREFLERLPSVPSAPWSIPCRAVGYFLLLLLLMRMKKSEGEMRAGQAAVSGLKIILCLLIMRALQWNYGGLILLVAVDILAWGRLTRFRGILLGLAFLMFALLNFEIISSRAAVISMDMYVSYYGVSARNGINLFYNLLNSVNSLLFMVYMILKARIQLLENERVRKLNTQLNAANEDLRVLNIQLEEYAREAERTAQTRERNRLAREIHDTLGHSLTGIIAGIDAAVSMMDYSLEGSRKQLELVSAVARQGMTDVRRSVKALRPDALEKQSLSEALEQIVGQARAAYGVVIDFENAAGELRFGSDEEEVIYRIVQEGITNAVRHGEAGWIRISIVRGDRGLRLCMRDDGKGCEAIHDGFGLTHMRERVELLGGTVAFDGSDGFGIEADIPIRWGETV